MPKRKDKKDNSTVGSSTYSDYIEDPLSVSLRIGENLHRRIGEIERVSKMYNWALLLLLPITVLFTLRFLLGFLRGEYIRLRFFGLILQSVVPVFLVVFWIIGYRQRHVFDFVKSWDHDFTLLNFVLKFELNPPEGKTTAERALNQLLKVSYVAERLKQIREEKPQNIIFNATIPGQSGKEYEFDVHVHDEWREYLLFRRQFDLFVKCFNGKEPVDEQDLAQLKEGIQDIAHQSGHLPNQIIVVSTASFTTRAFGYANNERNWIRLKEAGPSVPMDLIIETQKKRFKVVYFA